MNLVCIKCPRGCLLNIDKDGTISGNLCPRGLDYAKEEQTCPMRIVTSLVRSGNLIVPVKTTVEVPKIKIDQVLEEISCLNIENPAIGKIIKKNVCGTSADIIITGEPYIPN
ncbi:MAG: DUF1667 domain-containing protein [Clostridia bacterium]|nr:DUF1667 domain-containing protein [Clostridia bacterium]